MNDFEKIKQGQRGEVSIEENGLIRKKIPKLYLNKDRIEILLNQDIPNVVKYFDFKENPDGSGELIMENLESPNFSDKEKEIIEFFFSEIQKNVYSRTNYLDLDYESCNAALRNHISKQIDEFKNTGFQKDFIIYQELLNNKKLGKVFKDIFTGFKNLLKINIFLDDQKAEHVMYSSKEDSYKLIDII